MKDWWIMFAINAVLSFVDASIKNPGSERARVLLPKLVQLREGIDVLISRLSGQNESRFQ